MERLSIPGDVCTREAAHAKDSKQSTKSDLQKEKRRRWGEQLLRTRREEALQEAEGVTYELGGFLDTPVDEIWTLVPLWWLHIWKKLILIAIRKFLMMRGFEKHFRIKSSDIKTWRFGDDMSPLSNANYNKIVNVIYTIVSDKLH